MLASPKKVRGFTLIEMVIVIAIIGLTSSIVITSLSSNRSARETDRAIHVLAGALREAQNYALTGKSVNAAQENCYFAIRFTSATQYTLANYYRSGGDCTSYTTISTTTLPSGATFTGFGSYPTVLAFELPRAEVYSATDGALANLLIAQLIGVMKSSQTHYLCLYPTGRVEERGTDASCP